MILLAALTACDGAIIDAPSPVSGNETESAEVTSTGAGVAFNSERNAYFGDLHVHTGLSFDAYLGNVRTLPEDAYRFARGETITHANGMPVRLLGPPLDFVAVTDHAEYLGAMREANDPARRLSKDPLAAGLFSENPAEANAAFFRVLARYRANDMPEGFKAPDVIGRAWGIVQDAAEKYNEPGRFTTFVGYEFTSEPGGLNLHRNVLFRSATVPEFPFAALESEDPEDLWKKMEQWREEGADALAIPHNSNGSDGIMFELVRRNDEPMDADYAALRMRNEPLVEITQVKGTSDTHPILSPNDEWSDFELMEKRVGSNGDVTNFRGSYVRQALKDGLLLQETDGFNPFRFGFVGSSDTHNSAPGSVEEANYFSKAGVVDGTAELRSSVPPDRATTWPDGTPNSREASKPYQSWSSAGLVGVWAESNTRDMIFDALRRKETFATSGPRIKVRFFAGYDLAGEGGVIPESIAQMDAQAVPMGGDLSYLEDKAPEFFVWGLRDPSSAFLQRAQIVKGGSRTDNLVSRCSMSHVLTAARLTPRRSGAQTTSQWWIWRHVRPRRSRETSLSARCGRTRRSTLTSGPSTMCGYWKIRRAAGLPGTPFEMALRPTRRSIQSYRKGRGVLQSGMSPGRPSIVQTTASDGLLMRAVGEEVKLRWLTAQAVRPAFPFEPTDVLASLKGMLQARVSGGCQVGRQLSAMALALSARLRFLPVAVCGPAAVARKSISRAGLGRRSAPSHLW
tara:strand:+ start:2987 stop:5200 length:2214 start_codon:yes stop_codon:yes gene_type:complete